MSEQKVSRKKWIVWLSPAVGIILGGGVGLVLVIGVLNFLSSVIDTRSISGTVALLGVLGVLFLIVVGPTIGAVSGGKAAFWLLQQQNLKLQSIKITVIAGILLSLGLYLIYFFPRLPSGCPPDCSNANLLKADLSGIDLSRADLSGANLEDADLSGVDLSGANLSGARLYDADLSGANLSGANLLHAYLDRVDLSGTKIDEATQIADNWRLVWEIVNQGAEGRDLEGAYLWDANLSGADLSGANLSGAVLGGADLSGAGLSGTDLSGAYLSEANLHEVDLKRANLEGAVLEGANLTGANLTGANLKEADLKGKEHPKCCWTETDLSGADLSEADLSGATYNSYTIWPEGFDPVAAGAILEE